MPRIAKLNMQEISGVDYPAHLTNGWSIMKSADNTTKTEALLRALGRDNTMPTENKSLADATPAEIAELAKGLTAEQLQPIIDAVNSVVDGGIEQQEVAPVVEPDAAALFASIDIPEGATAEQIDKALGDKAPGMAALFKSLTSRVEKAESEAAEARKEGSVEKALRLDTEAIAKSKAEYKHLAFDHEKVAPAIRKFAEADAETAEVISGLLKALEGQAESAALFKELGTAGGGSETDAYAKIEARADEIVKSESVSKAVAITKALEESPELYTAYVKEGSRR